MIEGIYFFGEQLRWNLGWPNPNVGGAFVAMLLVLTVCINSRLQFEHLPQKVAKTVFVLLEVGLSFLLCKTYSRGALFALAAGFIYVYMLQCFSVKGASLKHLLLKSCLPRVFLFVGLLAVTGFWARIDPSYVSGDASVGNRMILWKAGLEMISLQPWSGWGIGQSGTQFMHWFQPLEETAQYAGMVNSYLHIGVERGLGVLFFWMFLGFLGVCLPVIAVLQSKAVNKGSIFMISGGAVMMVFMAANVFNTLWVFPKLWIPVAVAGVAIVTGSIICIQADGKKLILPSLICACLFSFVCLAGLYGVGKVLNQKRGENFRVQPDLIIFQPENPAVSPNRLILFPETEVYGDDWGKEVRRLALKLHKDNIQVIAPRTFTGSEFTDVLVPKGDGLLTVITSSTRPLENNELIEKAAKIFLLHPGQRPSETLNIPSDKLEILLPSLDITGTDGLWRREAKKQGWRVNKSGSFSRDVRSVWPEVMLEQ